MRSTQSLVARIADGNQLFLPIYVWRGPFFILHTALHEELLQETPYAKYEKGCCKSTPKLLQYGRIKCTKSHCVPTEIATQPINNSRGVSGIFVSYGQGESPGFLLTSHCFDLFSIGNIRFTAMNHKSCINYQLILNATHTALAHRPSMKYFHSAFFIKLLCR